MADELKTVLGFEAKEAIATLATLSKSLNAYTAAMARAASATGSFNKSAAGIEGKFKTTTPIIKKLGKELNIVEQSLKKYGRTASKLPSTHDAMRLQKDTVKKLGRELDLVNQSTQQYGKTVSKIPSSHPAMQQQKAILKQLGNATNVVNQCMQRYGKTVTKIPSAHPVIQKQKVAFKKLSEATGIVEKSLLKYGKTVTKLPSAHPAIKKQQDAFKKLGKTSADVSKKMVLSWESVIRIFAIQVIHQMISKITSSLGEAGREAIELENHFAEIQTIGGELKGNFEQVSEGVRALSDEFGVMSDIVAEGIYETLSNQVAEGAESFQFFAAATDFSIAAVTSADAAINLLSSTINAFGYNASQTAVISGKLFRTIDLGRIRGEEFANTFGRVAVLAHKLGVSLDEVLASIATLTISGLKYDEAFTLITNTMLKMIRPSEALKKVYEELGVYTPEAIIQAYGFQGALQKIVDSTDGSVKSLGNLFTRVRALRGILGLTGDATKKYVQNLEEIKKAGSEDVFEAKEIIFETNAKEIELELNRLKNAVVFDFGRPALGVINNIIQSMGGLVNMAETATASFAAMAVAALAVGVKFHPYIALAVAAGVVTAALVTKYRKFTKTAIDSIEERARAEEKAIAEINVREAELAENRIKFYNKQLAALQRYNLEKRAAMGASIIEQEYMEEYLEEDFKRSCKDKIKAFDDFVKSLEDRMEEGVKNIKTLQGEIFDLQRELSQEQFGGATEWRDDVSRASKILERGNKLRYAAQKAYRAGQKDQAKSYADEAKSLAEQAKSIGESAGNSVIIRRSSTLSKNVLKDGIKLREQELKFTQQEIEATKQLKKDIYAGKRVDIKVVTDIRKIFDDIQTEFDKPENAFDIMVRLSTGEKAGSKKAQLAFVNLKKTIEETERKTSDLEGRQKAYNNAVAALPGTYEQVEEALRKLAEVETVVAGQGYYDIPALLQPGQVETALNTIKQALLETFVQAQNLTDPKMYSAGLLSLKHQQAALEAIGAVDAAKGVQLLIDNLEEAKNASENIKVDIEGKEMLEKIKEIIKDAVEEEKKMGPAAKDAGSDIQGAMSSVIGSLQSVEQQARRTAAAIAAVGSGGGTTAHWGKLMYRAAGGAVGTDTVHAMLSPGEFVVNADSTKKFFSQLVAINSGVKPRFNSGGPVTNVGDININVNEASSAKQTARETMGAFRRELRRNTGRI